MRIIPALPFLGKYPVDKIIVMFTGIKKYSKPLVLVLLLLEIPLTFLDSLNKNTTWAGQVFYF